MVKSFKGRVIRCFLQHTSTAYLENYLKDKRHFCDKRRDRKYRNSFGFYGYNIIVLFE